MSLRHRTLFKPGVGGAGISPTPINLGTWDIREYCRLSGDHFYEVPDGYYRAGDLTNAPHAATAGTFKGYLILQPQTLGGAIIDMGPPGTALPGGLTTANGDFNIIGSADGGTSSGIILSGFKFRNGKMRNTAYNVHFWYPEITFPSSTWATESGRSSNTSYHTSNDTFLFGSGCVHCRIYAANSHDIGTGFYYQGGARYVYLIGSKIIRVTDGGSSVDVTDNIHPDAIAFLGGNIYNMWVEDCDVQPTVSGQGVQLQNFNGPVNNSAHNENINFSRVWVHNAYNAGFDIDSESATNPHHIYGTLTDVHVWNNGSSNGGQNSAAWQYVQTINFPDQATYTIGANPQPTRINMTATNCDTLVDASVGGTVTDPATVWQSASGHGYSDLVSFFGALSWVMV